MSNRQKDLRIALLSKENAETYLTNLEKLKSEGAVEEARYVLMKNEYEQKIKNANTNIERIKREISKELAIAEDKLRSNNQDLNDIELRHKVGQLPSTEYDKSRTKIINIIQKLQEKIFNLKNLIDAETSSDIEGAIGPNAEAVAFKSSSGKMVLRNIFINSFKIYKANPSIIIPSVAPLVISIIGSLIYLAYVGRFYEELTTQSMSSKGLAGLVVLVLVLITVYIIAFIFSEGIMIAMIKNAYSGGSSNLSDAFKVAKGKFPALLMGSILAAILLIVGYAFLIIPGIILTVFLYFIAQAIMISDASGMNSPAASYRFMRNNLKESVAIIFVSGALLTFVSLIGGMINIAGLSIGGVLCFIMMPFIISVGTIFYIDRS